MRTDPAREATPESFLPLTEVALEILLALAEDTLHGYGILLEVERRTAGRVRLRPGTLYRALSRLSEQGLIESRPLDGVDSERKLVYQPTALGREVVCAELRRLADVLGSSNAKHLLSEDR